MTALPRLRLAFMGSPAFAVPALRALHDAGHDIAAVYSQPPRPSGRGNRVTPCPVQQAAEALGLPVRTPARLRHALADQAAFAALDLDAAVVAAYGLILPQAMLDAPRRGCLNIHASLLPRWRGAGPIQAAVLAGDSETGVTIMQMDAGLDTGPMLLREAVPIGPRTTAAELHDALGALGARLIVQALADPPPPSPQPADGATYAPKLTRDSGRLDWTGPADALDRRVRGLTPWPGTWAMLAGEVLKVLDAAPEPWPAPSRAMSGSIAAEPAPAGPGPSETGLPGTGSAGAEPAEIEAGTALPGSGLAEAALATPARAGTAPHGTALPEAASMGNAPPNPTPPGIVLDDALLVACGAGALRLLRVQRPGRAPMDAAALLRGFPVPAGTVLA